MSAGRRRASSGGGRGAPAPAVPGDRWRSLGTEAVHPRAEQLDQLDTAAVVALLLDEEVAAARAVRAQAQDIARLAERFAAAIAAGGRVIYAGAGTSGRLGALDAAELPPTFGLSPGQVIAVVAGGAAALRRPVEGAEDRVAGAERAVARLGIAGPDLVIGIAASGVTPFPHAFLQHARRRGAATALVTCAGAAPDVAAVADLLVRVPVGPEVLAGSTRLKAGSATKQVLCAVSTAALVRLGHTYRGRLIDVQATNAKLIARARRTIEDLATVPAAEAARLLRAARGSVRLALAAALLHVSIPTARAALARSGPHLAALRHR